MTAQQVVERIQKNLDAPWKNPGSDIFHAGTPETDVTGIVTTFAPTLEVLRQAVANKKNMIISRESPFWDRGRPERTSGAAEPPRNDALLANPTYRFKQDYIAKNNLVLWRFSDNWVKRPEDGQLRGLAKALGWESYYKPSGGAAWVRGNGFFALPPTTLRDAAKTIKGRLKMHGMRILGDPQTRVGKAALWPGFFLVPQLQKILQEPGVDLVVIGEPVEWEASPYFADVVAGGQKKGMIILGQEVSEEPGCGEMAAWLKTIVPEVPIEWIPAGEPVWMPA